MRAKVVIAILVLLSSFVSPVQCLAGDEKVDSNDLAELKNLVLDMARQMQEMKQTHKVEIDALKAEVKELRESQATTGTAVAEEDEAAEGGRHGGEAGHDQP